MRLVTPDWPLGSDAEPPAKEKDSDTTGALLSCTSHAASPSGVVTGLMSTAPAAGSQSITATSAPSRLRQRVIGGFIGCPPAASAWPSPSHRGPRHCAPRLPPPPTRPPPSGAA